MRKLIFTLLLLSSLYAKAQFPLGGGFVQGRIARLDSVPAFAKIPGFSIICDWDSMMHFWDGSKWLTSLDSSRTNKLYASIGALVTKLNVSDTTGKWASLGALALKLNISDTVGKWAALSALATKLNISDTAAMLSAYLRKIDTAAMLVAYLRKIDTSGKWASITSVNSKLNISDTASMLSTYLRKIFATPSTTTRTLNSSFQPSATKTVQCTYTVQISCTITLTTGQSGTVFLEISPDNSTWTTVGSFTNTNTGSLTIGLNLTNTNAGQLSVFVPPNYYTRLRTNGTGTFTYISGVEQSF